MKAMTTTLIFAAALFCASGAAADDSMPNGAPNQSQPGSPVTTPATGTKNSKKEAWESKVRADCSAEIGQGGICENKDFDSGLEKCLHKNRSKLSDSCKNATHPRMHGKKMKKGAINEDTGAKPAQSQGAPNSAPAQAPSNP
ncbi:MAG TPA: hypothetical protein VN915_11335 [Elusimicrobiota bacterium]|nr:hypothetical protein [Elusimicrobiota bacterium]